MCERKWERIFLPVDGILGEIEGSAVQVECSLQTLTPKNRWQSLRRLVNSVTFIPPFRRLGQFDLRKH